MGAHWSFQTTGTSSWLMMGGISPAMNALSSGERLWRMKGPTNGPMDADGASMIEGCERGYNGRPGRPGPSLVQLG